MKNIYDSFDVEAWATEYPELLKIPRLNAAVNHVREADEPKQDVISAIIMLKRAGEEVRRKKAHEEWKATNPEAHAADLARRGISE